ncbi:MAG: dpnA [Armatimonadetes bacterium]|jgi:DNA modification methylase|nr:dpnA [Armatimonadota bacterium]
MAGEPGKTRRQTEKRANDLDGAAWTRASISVWNDLRKTPEETALKHPAMFPAALVTRLIQCFTRETDLRILDPFCGSGSTLVAAHGLGRHGIGFEVAGEYRELARRRLDAAGVAPDSYTLVPHSSQRIGDVVAPASVDLCVTSPPYWDILSRKRTADYRETRDYAEGEEDLSRVADYGEFVEALAAVFDGVYDALKPGKYCIINVMDLRKKDRFFPLHSDLAARLSTRAKGGRFIFDDLIIWDRRADYNNLRPLGFPAVFRINKVHEYLLIMQRPLADRSADSG